MLLEASDTMFEPVNFNPNDLVDLHAEEALKVVVEHAADSTASDMFLYPNDRNVQIKFRRMGLMEDLVTVPVEMGRHMISYAKTQSGMDITESRRPQDGRWLFDTESGKSLDLRTSTVATLYGEDMAIRISKGEKSLELEQLGMSRNQLFDFKSMLEKSAGLLLVTGPTGTGKTTTLYSALNYLNDGSKKINTVEDPIESRLPNIRQSQTNPKIGLEYPELLRSMLRQGADVLMIGEIRDEETARSAIRAANSGRLVLSSMHAPTAAAAIQSMLALGVNPYFLANSLVGVVAQQLVRKLCRECRQAIDYSHAAKDTFSSITHLLDGEFDGSTIFGPGSNCSTCGNQGYDGRTGMFEVMKVNEPIRRRIIDGASTIDLYETAIQEGMIEFRQTALKKVAEGEVTIEDVLRELPPSQR